MKKVLIATRLYELKVPMIAVFEVKVCPTSRNHVLSDIALTVYLCATINIHASAGNVTGKKFVWSNETSSKKRVASESYTPTKISSVKTFKSSRRADDVITRKRQGGDQENHPLIQG